MTDEYGNNTGRTIGYARVSTSEQDLKLQLDALKKCGVPKDLIFTDKASGSKEDRQGLDACLAELRPGDILLVWRLDRLGRSIRHLVSLIDDLQRRGIGFRSICDGAIDTTSASGELIFHVFSALAHFERRLIAERTKAGLVAARARGRHGGRPRLDAYDPRISTARTLHRDQTLSISEICSTLRCSRSTLYRWLNTSSTRSANALLARNESDERE
jgi:DNA invertase Pin-like site-specific DNA recombinase